MTRISNKTVFPTDVSLSGEEYLIGTDPDNSNNTRTYPLSSISAYIGENNDGITQNNIRKLVFTDKVSGSGLENAVIAVNSLPAFSVYDTQIITIVVPRTNNISDAVGISDQQQVEELFYDYYSLIDTGKGVYGNSGDIVITTDNLELQKTTEQYSLSSGFSEKPLVYVLNIANVESATLSVMANTLNASQLSGGYAITNNRDYYFELRGFASTSNGGNYKLYRFVGDEGTYGDEGVDQAVAGDFILVESSTGSVDKGITVRNIVIPAIIGEGAINNIADAVNNSFRGLISVGPKEAVYFDVTRKEIGSKLVAGSNVPTYKFYSQKYRWTRGKADNINSSSTVSDYYLISEKAVTSTVSATNTDTNPNIVALTATDPDAPQTALNAYGSAVVTDSTKDTLFLVYNSDIQQTGYKVYRFSGANGTYGDGQVDTAVLGDFTEITQLTDVEAAEDRKIYIQGEGDLIVSGSGTQGDPFVVRYDTEIFVPIQRTKKVSLSAAEIRNLGTTPIEAISSPGAGYAIEVFTAVANLTYGSIAFDGGNSFELKNTSATLAQYQSNLNFLAATADAFSMLTRKEPNAETQIVENEPLLISSTDSTVGDSTIDVYITYRIIEL